MTFIIFILFLVYTTLVFFLPNDYIVFVFVLINSLALVFCKLFARPTHKSKFSIKKVLFSTLKIMPFIIFTFIVNCILDNIQNATFVGIKLIIVCNITVIYSGTVNSMEVAQIIQKLCSPLKLFKINTDEIFVLVCISLSMIPILKNELIEIRSSCKAKDISFNIKNSKYIFSKFFLSLITRVNQLEEALISKGYDY